VLRSELRPGDVLLLEDTPDNTTVKHKGIRFGQRLTSLKFWRRNKGQTSLVHALRWIGNGYSDRPDVAEASGSGKVRTSRLPYGTYKIYSCTNSDLAASAADAATNWAKGGMINYAKGKALSSVFRSDKGGTHGLNRAQTYGNEIANSAPAWGQGGAFCSEFVVACYQAAAVHLGVQLQGDLLQCDAKHCSVRALHDRLFRDSEFKLAGYLDYDVKDMVGHDK
jgi:hypothetical protein